MAQSKTDGLKTGDRVRVSYEGIVESAGPSLLTVHVIGGDQVSTGFTLRDIEAETFAIEKIAPPIAVDDIVEWTVRQLGQDVKRVGRVWALRGVFAMVGDMRGEDSPILPIVVDVRLLRHG